MPFYEYECRSCKYYTEVMQKISDAPLTRCPSCGKRALKKLLSVPVFRLKGAGWYETDFKSDKETKRNLLGAEKEESKSESKSESAEPKPAGTAPKESKETAAAEAKSSKSVSTAAVATRHRATPRSGAARRPARAPRGNKARKKRR
ncbi:MAG TPA: zinc ribbon domain-containing protein [Steroidobacteraceae bacterium]|nr:zinc ribbon domain-containing protein [Steroidobacteraceae bacterium]